MLDAVYGIISIVLLFFALAVIYPHAQSLYHLCPEHGFWGALKMVVKNAKIPFWVAIFILIVFVVLQVQLGAKRDMESERLYDQYQQTNQLLNDISGKLDEVLQNVTTINSANQSP